MEDAARRPAVESWLRHGQGDENAPDAPFVHLEHSACKRLPQCLGDLPHGDPAMFVGGGELDEAVIHRQVARATNRHTSASQTRCVGLAVITKHIVVSRLRRGDEGTPSA